MSSRTLLVFLVALLNLLDGRLNGVVTHLLHHELLLRELVVDLLRSLRRRTYYKTQANILQDTSEHITRDERT